MSKVEPYKTPTEIWIKFRQDGTRGIAAWDFKPWSEDQSKHCGVAHKYVIEPAPATAGGQPKCTHPREDVCSMCAGLPKWTVDYVAGMYCYSRPFQAIADAHNVAIAAAKTTCDQCSRKLEDGALYEDHSPATAREWTHEKLQGLLGINNEDRYVSDHAFESTLDEINAAIAAERGKLAHVWECQQILERTVQQLRDQLATAVEVLKDIEFDPQTDIIAREMAHAALSKIIPLRGRQIKEGK